MLLDANLYSVDSESSQHQAAAQWLTEWLNGDRRVDIPWQTIGAFLTITTHPRVTTSPLTPLEAWSLSS